MPAASTIRDPPAFGPGDSTVQIAVDSMPYKTVRHLIPADAGYAALTPRNGKYSVDLARRRDLFEQRFLAITAYGRVAARDA